MKQSRNVHVDKSLHPSLRWEGDSLSCFVSLIMRFNKWAEEPFSNAQRDEETFCERFVCKGRLFLQ